MRHGMIVPLLMVHSHIAEFIDLITLSHTILPPLLHHHVDLIYQVCFN